MAVSQNTQRALYGKAQVDALMTSSFSEAFAKREELKAAGLKNVRIDKWHDFTDRHGQKVFMYVVRHAKVEG